MYIYPTQQHMITCKYFDIKGGNISEINQYHFEPQLDYSNYWLS